MKTVALRHDSDSLLSVLGNDPLASLHLRGSALADLAFGSLTRTAIHSHARPLALLPSETLELDLSDPAQRQFGDYELLELIGEGGMGVVYRARQQSLDREVAVKLLAAGPWASREFVERFRREAQNAARMQHPNIVAIYEVGSAEELHFFSMRLVHGPSLAAVVRSEGKLPPQHAASLLRTIAEALDYAHRLGVLHLDLKPANVLIDENGAPHVADFGLARRLDSALVADTDEVSGTPSYMAPEQAQARSQKITPATDIWGLGAILYELVTGQPPFLGDSPQGTLRLVVEGKLTSPRHYSTDLPRDLEAIILKCMARNAAERYPSARALADDLGRFLEHRAVKARPLNAPQRVLRWAKREPKLAIASTLGLAALVIGLIATTQQWRRADSNALRAEGNAQLALNNAALANHRLWQTRIDQAAVAVSNGHGYDVLPGLAATIKEREAQGLDVREDRIRIAAVERSAPRLIDAIAMGSGISGIALSPDGDSVAVATEDGKLRLIDTATGKERWQTSFKNSTHFFVADGEIAYLVLLRFSPDGRYLIGRNHPGVTTMVQPSGFDEVLFDLASGKVLLPPATMFPNFRDATYSPDGGYAMVRSVDQRTVLMRTADWHPLGVPQPFNKVNPPWLVTTNARHVLTMDGGMTLLDIADPRTLAVRHRMNFPTSGRITAWASSPDGDSVLLGRLDGKIERVDCVSGRSVIISPSPVGRIGWIAFSPDGRWFGAVADTGEVMVWGSVTYKMVAPLMHLNVNPKYHRDQLFIDATARTVIASVDLEMGLWYLPDAVSPPVRLLGESPNASASWVRAFAYDAPHGLIATDGGQGELSLWRVQQLAPRGLRGSPLPADPLRAESGQIISVDGENVRLVNAADGRALGPLLKLPQAASFAELTTDGASLVVIAGHRIFVYDATKWTLRRAPIVLPNDPARLFLSPDSRHAFVLFADYDNGINREVGQVWDLVEGTAVSEAVPYEAATHFRFAADGRSLLLWMADHMQLLDAATLKARWPMVSLAAQIAAQQKPEAGNQADAKILIQIAEAQISADQSSIDVLTVGGEASGGDASRLWQFDAATGQERKRALLSETGGADSFALMPDRRHAIIQRSGSRPLWWDEMHGVIELPAASASELGALALASDASMFARAGGMDVVALTATSNRQWLTPPLSTAVPTFTTVIEHPTQLIITRDGTGLIGRTRIGEWLYWDIGPDTRSAERIAREAALLNPDQAAVKNGLAAQLPESERQTIRANDPGPPIWIGGFPQDQIPQRQPNLPANLVDLSAFYNEPLSWVHSVRFSTYRELAPGMHRFFGIDYDVRGIVALSMKGFESAIDPDRPPPFGVRGIHPGVDRFAALNLLVAGFANVQREKNRPYAMVEIDYRDGGREHLPLIDHRDVDASWSDEEGKPGEVSPRVAWRATNVGAPNGGEATSKIFSVRIANPHPDREVVSLALESVDEAWSAPLFFAITAEPLGSVDGKPSSDKE